MSEQARHFAVCIRNEDYEASLELCKIYEVLDDSEAEKHNLIRVIDEEGEDYLYSKEWFLSIELPHKIEEAIVHIARS